MILSALEQGYKLSELDGFLGEGYACILSGVVGAFAIVDLESVAVGVSDGVEGIT